MLGYTEAEICKSHRLSDLMCDALTTARVTEDAVIVRNTVMQRTMKALALRDLAVTVDGFFYLTELGKEARSRILADRADRKRTAERVAEINAARVVPIHRPTADALDELIGLIEEVDAEKAASRPRIAPSPELVARFGQPREATESPSATEALLARLKAQATASAGASGTLEGPVDPTLAMAQRGRFEDVPGDTFAGARFVVHLAALWPKGARVWGVDTAGKARIGTVDGFDVGMVDLRGHENYGRGYVGVKWEGGGIVRTRHFTDELVHL